MYNPTIYTSPTTVATTSISSLASLSSACIYQFVNQLFVVNYDVQSLVQNLDI